MPGRLRTFPVVQSTTFTDGEWPGEKASSQPCDRVTTVSRRLLLGCLAAGCTVQPRAQLPELASFGDRIRALEQRLDCRIGIAARDTISGRTWQHRGDERFPLTSTFKLLLAAAVLQRTEQEAESLEQSVSFSEADMMEYAPVTRDRVADGSMTLAELCEAAIAHSDNTAANLLLAFVDGPEGLTRMLRSWGDTVTRLDRTEPTLNEARPGDERDSTTPNAMLASLQHVLLGSGLERASRDQLALWLESTTTGDKRLRAGLPSNWRLGHKTGTGQFGTTNDVGIAWPPTGGPYLLAVYLTECSAPISQREAALAEIANLVSNS